MLAILGRAETHSHLFPVTRCFFQNYAKLLWILSKVEPGENQSFSLRVKSCSAPLFARGL